METSDSSSDELKVAEATKKKTQLNIISYAEHIPTPKSIANPTKFHAQAKALDSLPSATIVPNDGFAENLIPENIALHFSERKDDELEPKKKKNKVASAEKPVESELDTRNYVDHYFWINKSQDVGISSEKLKKEERQCS